MAVADGPWANNTVRYAYSHALRMRWLQNREAKAERLVAEGLKKLG